MGCAPSKKVLRHFATSYQPPPPPAEDDEFPFDQLPHQNQLCILEKLTHEEHATLSCTNKRLNILCEQNVAKTPAVADKLCLDDEDVHVVYNDIATKFPFKTDALPFSSMHAEVINIPITRPTNLTARVPLPQDYLQHPAVQSIEEFVIEKEGLSELELLALHTPTILIKEAWNITPTAINSFLKQWKNGTREIKLFFAMFRDKIRRQDVATIIEDLDANVIWSAEHHYTSVLRNIPFGKYCTKWPIQTRQYSLFKSSNISEIYLLLIHDWAVKVMRVESETQVLYNDLNDDQWYLVLRTCRICRTQYCPHHPPPNWHAKLSVATSKIKKLRSFQFKDKK